MLYNPSADVAEFSAVFSQRTRTRVFRVRSLNRHVDFIITHSGLVTPYGDIDLGQHWLRQWLVAWQHQAITRSNDDFSLRSLDCFIHLRAISQCVPNLLFCIYIMSLKIILLKLLPHLPRANDLNHTQQAPNSFPARTVYRCFKSLESCPVFYYAYRLVAIVGTTIPVPYWIIKCMQLT